MKKTLPDVVKFTDYRKFLKAYYDAMKLNHRYFSYKYFADKAGFRNKGFIYNVIKGVKNLSKYGALKLARAMNLNNREQEYFENLVAYNQTRTPEEQSLYYSKMVESSGPRKSDMYLLRKSQYDFFSRYYHPVIRSLIEMCGFDGDYSRLAKSIYPPITPGQAKKSVALLLKLGLIKKTNGRYRVPDKTVSTGDFPVSPAILKFHVESMSLAQKATLELPRDQRNITGLTLGLSKQGYETLCNEISLFRKKLLDIAEKDRSADRVIQVNFHAFPVSGSNSKGAE